MAPLRKTGITLLGWLLVAVGIVALALPGPGLLLLLAGLVVLSGEYSWAERRVEPVRRRTFDVARSGVATYPRILLSAAGASLVVAVGVFWWLDPKISEVGPIGPDLPLGGWSTGLGIIASGVVAWALLIYSVAKFRGDVDAKRESTPVS